MTKVKIQQLNEFYAASANLAKKNPAIMDTKLGYSIQKVSGKISEWTKPLKKLGDLEQEEINDAIIDYCEVSDGTFKDPTGVTVPKGIIIHQISRDARGTEIRNYMYTPAQQKACLKKQNEIHEQYDTKRAEIMETEVEITPSIVAEVPAGLTGMELEIFSGIVIPEGFQYTAPVPAEKPVDAPLKEGAEG